jgi:hypothetical protein
MRIFGTAWMNASSWLAPKLLPSHAVRNSRRFHGGLTATAANARIPGSCHPSPPAKGSVSVVMDLIPRARSALLLGIHLQSLHPCAIRHRLVVEWPGFAIDGWGVGLALAHHPPPSSVAPIPSRCTTPGRPPPPHPWSNSHMGGTAGMYLSVPWPPGRRKKGG